MRVTPGSEICKPSDPMRLGSPRSRQPEKAQITVGGADHLYRDLRIENTLLDEHGDEVKLEKGARVEITVSVGPETPTAASDEDGELTRP